ncbi:MAG: hypothetical protein N3D17_04590 [bacterium]|nr:hypothetical protein [bacterium]
MRMRPLLYSHPHQHLYHKGRNPNLITSANLSITIFTYVSQILQGFIKLTYREIKIKMEGTEYSDEINWITKDISFISRNFKNMRGP